MCNRLKTGFNATRAESDKNKKYHTDFKIPKGGFIPLGFEGNGAWGDSAYNFFSELANLEEEETKKQPDRYAWNRAACTIGKAIRRANTMYLDNIRGVAWAEEEEA